MDPDSPLWVAAALGDQESVRLLSDQGAKPDYVGAYDMTPLHIAIAEEHDAIVRLLLDDRATPLRQTRTVKAQEPKMGDCAEIEGSTNTLPKRLIEAESGDVRLESALGGGSQVPEPSDLERTSDYTLLDQNLHTEPKSHQPLDFSSRHFTDALATHSSTNGDLTTQQPEQCWRFLHGSASFYPTSSGHIGLTPKLGKHQDSFDLLDLLSEAKAEAKANGFKKFEPLGDF